jgi:hypothetical protein
MHNRSQKQCEDTDILAKSIVEAAREKPPTRKEPPKRRPERKEPPKDPSRKKEPPKEPPPKKLDLKLLEDWTVSRGG